MEDIKDIDKIINENFETFKDLLRSTERHDIDNLIKYLEESDFKLAPASTKYHNSYKGGLLEHSLQVYKEVKKLNQIYNYYGIPEDNIIIMCLLHEIYKINYYSIEYRNTKTETGTWIKQPYYTVTDMYPIGTSEKSIIMLQYIIKLTDIEITNIRNQKGEIYGVNNINNTTKLLDIYPEAMLLQIGKTIATYKADKSKLSTEIVEIIPDDKYTYYKYDKKAKEYKEEKRRKRRRNRRNKNIRRPCNNT